MSRPQQQGDRATMRPWVALAGAHLSIALLSIALLSIAGCSDAPGPVPCSTTAECAARAESSGHVCVASACRPCTADVDCAGADRYGLGATCVAGRCTAAECAPGEPGCESMDGGGLDASDECTGGVGPGCDSGIGCEGDRCDAGGACPSGDCDAGCSGSSCDAGVSLGCDGCACRDDGTCDPGLACSGGVCRPACPAGTEGCPCVPGGACESGLSCDPTTSLCAACLPGDVMCACAAGRVCGTGLACEASPMCPGGTSECCVPSACGPGSEGTIGCTCRTTDPACGPGAACRAGLCGCDENHVGERCEIACTDAELMTSAMPVFDPAADQGFWLCGHFAASDDAVVAGGTLTVRGEVPITPTDGAPLVGGGLTVTSR